MNPNQWKQIRMGFNSHLQGLYITLSSKPGLTFLKEHQTGACRFDALSRANLPQILGFT
jgi:hypothetical protein